MPQGFSIAIDGPVASGKGTLAQALSNKLLGLNINTGAMYRAVALICVEKGLSLEDASEVESVLGEVNMEFDNEKVILNGRDITERIKEPDISHGSSVVAVYPRVRQAMVKKQQKIAQESIDEGKVVIMEGRDIGTVVLPNATFKIFLTASEEIRAKRRLEQYKHRGLEESFDEMLKDVRLRDERDSGREVDPLPSNPEALGYFVVDDSGQTEEETINVVLGELKKRGLLL